VVLDGLPPPPLFGPSLSTNGRSLVFAAGGDLYSARRLAIGDTTFFDVRSFSTVNGDLPELTPRVSHDGRTLFFSLDTDGSGFFRDLMQSRRQSPGDPFGAPTALTALNDPFWSELSPEPSFDGQELLFASSRPGGPGLFDIWRARRSNDPNGAGSGASFGEPQPVASLSSPEDDSGVTLTADGLTAVLSSARDGTIGNRDLWLATRASRFDDFVVELNLTELNTPDNDTDPAWRSDGGELLFSSDRSGESLLYAAVRPCQR
jgi:Tol biopolymer transport system component